MRRTTGRLKTWQKRADSWGSQTRHRFMVLPWEVSGVCPPYLPNSCKWLTYLRSQPARLKNTAVTWPTFNMWQYTGQDVPKAKARKLRDRGSLVFKCFKKNSTWISSHDKSIFLKGKTQFYMFSSNLNIQFIITKELKKQWILLSKTQLHLQSKITTQWVAFG